MVPFLPLRKVKRNGKYLLLGAVFVTAAVAAYLEYAATNAVFSKDLLPKEGTYMNQAARRENGEDSSDISWRSKYVHQLWKPEYKGQANLHVFEDWCGSSVASLRKNLHYPLYPHSRLTVKKLAVAPSWMNYGLRIFGYIHPYTHGQFLFAVASSNNCEFWLSLDESPDNLRLCAYVGMSGKEWTAPGEYMKYHSQISKPILLQEQKRYYFELIHKHSDKETDHVEVAWQLNESGKMFALIDSNSLSLYTNESSLKLSDVSHIPQTVASHATRPKKTTQIPQHEVDILREDPRDTFFQRPLLDRSYLQNVLPICHYKPSVAIKGFKLSRYQGLQFVHLSYVYPNDFTRLTHMEHENKCFYKKQYYFQGRYMRLDNPNNKPLDYRDKDRIRRRKKLERDAFRDTEREGTEREWMDVRNDRDEAMQGYQDDYNKGTVDRRRKLLSGKEVTMNPRKARGQIGGEWPKLETSAVNNESQNQEIKENEGERHQLRNQSKMEDIKHFPHSPPADGKKQVSAWAEEEVRHIPNPGNNLHLNQLTPDRVQNQRAQNLGAVNGLSNQMAVGVENKGIVLSVTNPNNIMPREENNISIKLKKFNGSATKTTAKYKVDTSNQTTGTKDSPTIKESKRGLRDGGDYRKMGRVYPPNRHDGRSNSRRRFVPKVMYDPVINWAQTFQVSPVDFQALRNDWIDLTCNVSGNLLMSQSEAVAVVREFMEQLSQNFPRQFSLQQIVNVEKQVNVLRGNRYLLELELLEASGRPIRLVHYVYVLKRYKRGQTQAAQTQSVNTHMQLCVPPAFRWNPNATVHFIVPVKNQARWVQKFIVDMEELYKATKDENFNVIIVDYSSTDVDVEQALKNSQLPRSQYIRQKGNFKRSEGLQGGTDLITDKHSIVFLCDLHIHFPLSFIDSVRKHCIEGHMAFAPIVMRLSCGATPQEPHGYWEMNGFGLLGIYKSDLDSVGGMNTKEFTEGWGGEDWELVDRIIQAGLEVKRLYMRNFFHYYHSRRGMWNHRTPRLPNPN